MNNQKFAVAGLTGALLLSLPLVSWAAQAGNDIAWGILVMELMGGLALFLAGLEQLSDGLKKVAGDALKVMLARLTTNRVSGAITGAVVTGILNSSSITTVLVVGFVTAGILTMFQTAGKALRNDDIDMMRSLVREDDKIDFLETACLN